MCIKGSDTTICPEHVLSIDSENCEFQLFRNSSPSDCEVENLKSNYSITQIQNSFYFVTKAKLTFMLMCNGIANFDVYENSKITINSGCRLLSSHRVYVTDGANIQLSGIIIPHSHSLNYAKIKFEKLIDSEKFLNLSKIKIDQMDHLINESNKIFEEGKKINKDSSKLNFFEAIGESFKNKIVYFLIILIVILILIKLALILIKKITVFNGH